MTPPQIPINVSTGSFLDTQIHTFLFFCSLATATVAVQLLILICIFGPIILSSTSLQERVQKFMKV